VDISSRCGWLLTLYNSPTGAGGDRVEKLYALQDGRAEGPTDPIGILLNLR